MPEPNFKSEDINEKILNRENINFEKILELYEKEHAKVEISTEQSEKLFETLLSYEGNSVEHIIEKVHANLDKKTKHVNDLDKEREEKTKAQEAINEKEEEANKVFVEKFKLSKKLDNLDEQKKTEVLKKLREFVDQKNLESMEEKDLQILQNTLIEKIDSLS